MKNTIELFLQCLGFGRSRETLVALGLIFITSGILRAQSSEPGNGIPFPSASNIERCGAGSVTFAAEGCTAGYTTKWYGNTWGGGADFTSELGSGTTFTTPVLYDNAVYWLACVSDTNPTIRSSPANVFAIVFLSATVTIVGDDTLCSNREGSYRGFPKGGAFSIPEGLPEGFLTIDSVNSTIITNPGFDVPTFSLGYTFDNALPECSGSVTKTITRISAVLPTVNSPTIYEGQTATLTVENCPGEVQWVWTYEANTTRIYVSPAYSSQYFAECKVEGICDSQVKATVTVLPLPESIVKITGPDTVCLGSLPVTYVAAPAGGKFILPKGLPSGSFTSHGSTLTFNRGLDILSTSFSYELTKTDSVGVVTALATKNIAFSTPPKPTITASVTICRGGKAALQVDNCLGDVTWSTRDWYPIITVSPSVTTEYSARCTVGGCDTTLTTKVTVNPDGVLPALYNVSTVCSRDEKSYDVVFEATEGSTISSSLGVVQGSRIIGVPAGRWVEITATLNGCPVTERTNQSCSAGGNCADFYPSITPSMASCSGSGANNDATIDLGHVYADRYSFAETRAELSDYANADPLGSPNFIISNLPNPTSAVGRPYFFRLFGRSDTCRRDTVVVVPFRDCSVPCAKPNAGEDLFISKYHDRSIKLPNASPQQKWVLGPGRPFDVNDATFVDPSAGFVFGLDQSGKYPFVLQDGGAGGPCADTVSIFVGPAEVSEITTYSDTITLPKILLGTAGDATYGIWTAMPGNPSTLNRAGQVSGLTRPGRYLFRMTRPFNPYSLVSPYNPFDTLTVVVVKKDCPPQLCVPFSVKRVKLAAE